MTALVVLLAISSDVYAHTNEAPPKHLLDEWLDRPAEELMDVWQFAPPLVIPGFTLSRGTFSVRQGGCTILFEVKEGRVARWDARGDERSCEKIAQEHRPRDLQGTPLPWKRR